LDEIIGEKVIHGDEAGTPVEEKEFTKISERFDRVDIKKINWWQ
jgi:hypothetical protein